MMIKVRQFKKAFIYRDIEGHYLMGIPNPKNPYCYLGVPIVGQVDGVWISPKKDRSLNEWDLEKFYKDFLDLTKTK